MSADPLCRPLARLHTRVRDVISGHETLKARAEGDLARTARRMPALHGRHAGALAGMLGAMGCEASSSGSVMSVVQSGAVAARDWAGGLDEEILARVARGERALVDLYSEALAAFEGRGPGRLVLLEQRRGLLSAIEWLDREAAAA